MKSYQKIILAITLNTILILAGFTWADLITAAEQTKEKMALSQDHRRDPFLLPAGVHLLSKSDMPSEKKRALSKGENKPTDLPLPSFNVRAILISDHIRLALIDSHIVTVGDLIQEEKVFEINTDRVVLGKGNQRRTLLLSQNPVSLTVEEKNPSLPLPHKGGRKEGNKGDK